MPTLVPKMKVVFEKKKKKFLSRDNVESQFKNVEDIMKIENHYFKKKENHYLAGTVLHPWMQKLKGKCMRNRMFASSLGISSQHTYSLQRENNDFNSGRICGPHLN